MVDNMLVSYAQNFEDVILWRALKDVKDGLYIDVGAHDPDADSVSLLFYQRGWRGIHLEPVHEFAERLRLARPDEEVIEAAIGSETGPLTFYKIGDTGLSTGDAAIAARHQTAGFPIETRKVPCLPLSEILSRFGQRDIHWLKIDVEGMERSVIDSWLPSQARPWIVIMESTEPNSPTPNFASWEPLLLKLGYEFVYFDGLNRFYVSETQPQLKLAFGAGPNYFDGFSLTRRSFFTRLQAAEQSNLEQNISELRQDLSKSRDDFDRQDRLVGQLQLAIGLKDSTISSKDLSIDDLNSRLAAQGKLVEEAQFTIAAQNVAVVDLTSRLAEQEKLVAEGGLVI
jgi:FkbM family methyltransferase